MAQKIIKVGTSAAVTLSKSALQKLGYKIGDYVEITVDAGKRAFVGRAASVVENDTVDWARGFMKKYDKALKALAK